MTQEDKELLLKDLCARLPYGVKAKVKYWGGYNIGLKTADFTIMSVFHSTHFNEIHCQNENGSINVLLDTDKYSHDIKPFLFPLSSMTEKQKIELTCIIDSDYAQIDWYNKNHFDYRGLIPLGLAVDATGLGVY